MMANPPLPEKISTIIAVRPGVMQQALRMTLAQLSHIEISGAAGGGLSAFNLAHKDPPALLIIDASLPEDEILALLRSIKQELPQTRCLVLAETTRQQQVMLAAGADAVLLRGEATERFKAVLDEIGMGKE
jgi:DNA-binding NarL/FixJ family response regulator